MRPTFIAISGGSASGKSTFAAALGSRLNQLLSGSCSILAQDSYYFDLLDQQRMLRDDEIVNFDHPRSIDFPLIGKHLGDLREGQTIEVPRYCFKSNSRQLITDQICCDRFVLVDGTLLLSQPQLHPHFDFLVFIDCPEELRFSRRLHRDTRERGRTAESVYTQFNSQVKPMHDLFIEPSKDSAHMILPGDEPIEITVDRFLSQSKILAGLPTGMAVSWSDSSPTESTRTQFAQSAL